jgi:hypothetical protein
MLSTIINVIILLLICFSNIYFLNHYQHLKYFVSSFCILLMPINFYIFSKKIYEKILFMILILISLYLFLGPSLLFQKESVKWNKMEIKENRYQFSVSLNRIFDYPIKIEKVGFSSSFNIHHIKNGIILDVKKLNVLEYHKSSLWLWYKLFGIPFVTNINIEQL